MSCLAKSFSLSDGISAVAAGTPNLQMALQRLNMSPSFSNSFSRRCLQGKSRPITLQRRTNRRLRVYADVANATGSSVAGALSGSHLKPPGNDVLHAISCWIWLKLRPITQSDWFVWLPPEIHAKLHSSEVAAVLFVRELLVAAIVVSALKHMDSICRKLNWIWGTSVMRDEDVTDEEYCVSGFSSLVAPIQFVIVVMTFTRWSQVLLYHVCHMQNAFDNVLTDRTHIVAIVFALTWFLMGWKNRAMKQSAITNNLDKTRLCVIDRLGTVTLVSLGGFIVAETLGIPLKSISAFGGITGIAVGLASKEVVTNFFGGLVLWLSQPFAIGDGIKLKDFSSVVKDVGFFQTKLIGFDKMEITVPNHVFTNMVITNLSRATHRNMHASFELRIEDMFRVDAITKKITKLLGDHPAMVGRPVCYLKSIGNCSLFIEISGTAKSMSSGKFYAAQQEILVNAAKIIIDEGGCFGTNGYFPPVEVPKMLFREDTGNGNGNGNGGSMPLVEIQTMPTPI